MNQNRLLLFSNSTNAGEDYMAFTLPFIDEFLKNSGRNALFIPFAGISLGFDSYYELVSDRLKRISVKINSLHVIKDKKTAIRNAGIIITGGGNTFCLLKTLQDEGLLDEISDAVMKGCLFIGWSAGANIACPTICTTNDMPVVQPHNLNALKLVPFQINPHYTDFHPPGHAGETREMRLKEYTIMNRHTYVAGLREGSLFQAKGTEINLLGNKSCRIFHYGNEPAEVQPGEKLNFLMQ